MAERIKWESGSMAYKFTCEMASKRILAKQINSVVRKKGGKKVLAGYMELKGYTRL
jgi:hypothetical protein